VTADRHEPEARSPADAALRLQMAAHPSPPPDRRHGPEASRPSQTDEHDGDPAALPDRHAKGRLLRRTGTHTRTRASRRTRARRYPFPERFLGTVFAALFLLLAFAAIAHASGSGWVQAIGAVTAGLAFVGMIGPAFVAARLQVSCNEAPRDGTTGEPLVIELVANHPLRCTLRRPESPSIVLPASEAVRATVTPPTRGVLSSIRVRVATAAPLGLLWWSVDRVVLLPQPIEVAPTPSRGLVFGTETGGDDEGHGRPILAQTGEIRGVRAYQHGDSRRRVHWRATAHTGTLMIRETEQMPDTPVKIVADLSDDPLRAEQQASEILGAVSDLLANGKRVLLETVEEGQRVSALVSDRRSAGRRLARTGRNPYDDLPTIGPSGRNSASRPRRGPSARPRR
jgi:uncharacterized protein (DUF58 family)